MYICESCGSKFPIAVMQCPSCGGIVSQQAKSKNGIQMTLSRGIFDLGHVSVSDSFRLDTGISELNRVFGGGITENSTTVIGGHPGSGKTTLMTQVALNLNSSGYKIMYISGEESESQVKERTNRLEIFCGKSAGIILVIETSIITIIELLRKHKPKLAIIDSIQILTDAQSVTDAVSKIQVVAKQIGTSVIFIGHATKSGDIAGENAIKHTVDTVLRLEDTKDIKFLKAEKNRFGQTDVGVFKMEESGLVPTTYKIDTSIAPIGRTYGIYKEIGLNRMFPVIIECLTIPGKDTHIITNIDQKKAKTIWALLGYNMGDDYFDLSNYQFILKSNLPINDNGIDLAIAGAMLSSIYRVEFPFALIGELALSGIIENADNQGDRLREAKELGIKTYSSKDMNHIHEFISIFREEMAQRMQHR